MLPLQQYLPFTVLKQKHKGFGGILGAYKLQQYLPFTVLKQSMAYPIRISLQELQQYLPFTVLKHGFHMDHIGMYGCNSTYRLRY